MNLVKKFIDNRKFKVLEKYVDNLQILTSVIGDDEQKGGVVLKFKSQYGGGQVRFQTKKEMVEFCNALGAFAEVIKK